MAKHMVKFHPNFHSNNICQEYLKIYGQTLAKNNEFGYIWLKYHVKEMNSRLIQPESLLL